MDVAEKGKKRKPKKLSFTYLVMGSYWLLKYLVLRRKASLDATKRNIYNVSIMKMRIQADGFGASNK